MLPKSLGLVVLVYVTSTLAKRRTDTECALFKSTDHYVYRTLDPAYIDMGTVDVGYYFSISMDILVGPMSQNGQLYSVSNKDPFDFYEWPPEVGKKTVYIAMELSYGALAIHSKQAGVMFGHNIEIFPTWPVAYDVYDGDWHHATATRDEYIGKVNISIDDILIQEDITDPTGIQIDGAKAYLGGRPGYIESQFTGVIKNVKVNGYDVTLGDKPASENGHVEVVPCSSKAARKFIEELYAEDEAYSY